jgi:hypothetical protein
VQCGYCLRTIPEEEFDQDQVLVTLVGAKYCFVQRACYERKLKAALSVTVGYGPI